MAAVEVYRYGYALDEIYGLRAGAAYEATILDRALSYTTLPARARTDLEGMRDRLREAARGAYDNAWYHVGTADMKAALRAAGAPENLTRETWEAERV